MAIIIGNCGDNILSTKKRGDIVLGLDGDDELLALHGFNILLGGDGDDRLTALSSFNILSGGAGNDTIRAERGWNLVLGGDGDDDLYSSSDSNVLEGGEGNDSLTVLAGSGNILHGGDGDDLFNILGGSGNTVKGGDGRDTISYAGTTQGVFVNLAAGLAAGVGTLSGIENVTGSEGNDTITGDDNDNVLAGGGGNDTLEGGAGNDIVDGGAGDDLIIGGDGAGDDTYQGGDGIDTVSYASTSQGVIANLITGMATGAEIGTDTLIGIENLIGGTGNDTLTGDDNANVLEGSAGDDTIDGSAGNDTIDGGAGDDTITGGAGNDILEGGAGIDTLSYEDSPSRVIVNMFNTGIITIGGITVQPGTAFDGFSPAFPLPMPDPPTDTVSGFETVIGSAFGDHIQGSTNVANLLIGGAGNDFLAGSGASDGIFMPPLLPVPGAANDTLLGGAGDDVLRQSRGNDVIDGGTGFDRLEFLNNGIPYGGTTGVNVDLGMGFSDADPNNGDAVHGPGGDVATISSIEFVVGTAGDDVFTGGDPLHEPFFATGQTEFFQPLGGNDTITGMAGRGWSTAVDYGSNNSLQPVTVVLGNSNNIGKALDGFDSDPLTVGVQPYMDTLIEVDLARGGAGNDSLMGGSYSQGASGVFLEQFRGGPGNDTIDGGGSDTVIGAYGVVDRVEYGNSQFAVVVNLGTAPISGNFYGAGIITVNGGTARDGFSSTGGGTDTLIDINVVRGSSSSDTLVGGNPKFDNLERFEGLAGNDFINGGSGNDEADYSTSTAAVLVNIGAGTALDGFDSDPLTVGVQPHTDTLMSVEWARGGSGNDTLIGGANALERFTGGAGNDSIDGGSMAGVNYASFHIAPSGANAFIENGVGTASDDGQGGTDTLANINGLWGSNYADTLTGGLGDQWFVGQGGDDLIDGGVDTDTVSYRADPNGVTANLALGTATDGWGGIWNLQGTDTLSNIENIEGSNFNDTLIGDGNANRIAGLGGDDTIDAGAGDDVIVGGDGAGDDTYQGGEGSDTVSYESTTQGVIANLATGLATGIEIGTDTFSSIENLVGGAGSDTLTGDDNANTIEGLAGNDTLTGGAGIDTLSYEDSPSRVIVNMFNTGIITIGGITVQPGTAFDGFSPAFPLPMPDPPTDTVSGFETVIGSAFGDHIQGSTNVANLLIGGAGNDFLAGSGASDGIFMPPLLPVPGAANDTLLGGAGDDVLRQSRGNDVIDGGTGFDRLEFLNNGIPYGGTTGVNVDLGMGFSDADPNNGDAVHGPGGDVATISSIEFVVGTAGDDVFTGGDPLHEPFFATGQTEFFQPLGGNDTITGMAGRGWSTAVDYGSNNSLQPVTVVLGNSNNIGKALDGFDSDPLTVGVQPYMDTLIEVDLARGGAGNDSLMGGSYSQGASGVFLEQFRGGPGNDTIDGGGSDTVIGAYGVVDRVEYGNSQFAVVVNLGTAPISGNFYGAGIITVNGGTARDGFSSTGGGTDTLIDINVVRGSSSSDTLVGGNPKFDNLERFEGLAGNDFINGGSGNDEADYSTSTAAVLVNIGAGTALDGFDSDPLTVGVQPHTDTLMSVEWARGGSGNDTLIGGANALERFTGGAGNDSIDGGSMAGVNYASFHIAPSGANAFIENGVGTASDDGQGGTDTLANINGLWGSNYADTLTGGLGDQWFVGQGGDDLIDGGVDTDTVSYRADPNGVTANLALGTATDGWGGIWNLQGTDTLSNIENIEGSNFNDTLIGDANANVLDGGGGSDTLTGGASADAFNFGVSATNNTVTDFDDDVLDFSPLFAAAGIEAPAGEDPLDWLVNEGYLIADSSVDVGGGAANDTVVQVDLDGSAGAGGAYTVVTLMDATLGTTGGDSDNWLV